MRVWSIGHSQLSQWDVIFQDTASLTVNSNRVPQHRIKQIRDALAIVRAADRLCQDVRDVEHLDLVAPRDVLLLRERVRHDDLLQRGLCDLLERVGGQDPVRDERDDAGRAGLLEVLGGES